MSVLTYFFSYIHKIYYLLVYLSYKTKFIIYCVYVWKNKIRRKIILEMTYKYD